MPRFFLLWAALFFVLGVGAARMGEGSSFWGVLVILSIGSGWAVWLLGFSRATTLLILPIFFCMGGFRLTQEEGVRRSGLDSEGNQVYEGKVISYPQPTLTGGRFLLALERGGELGEIVLLSTGGEKRPERGDRIRFRARLKRPRNLGNHREFDFEIYAQARGIEYRALIWEDDEWVRMEAGGSILSRWRKDALARASFFLNPETLEIFRSQLLGEKRNLSPERKEEFRKAGVLHLLVVSGFHVATIALMVGGLAGWLLRRSSWLTERVSLGAVQIWAGFMGAALFCALTDLPIPTLRALWGLALVALAATFYRSTDRWNLFALVLLALLIYQPLFLFDLSTQLSFSAVAGILWLMSGSTKPGSPSSLSSRAIGLIQVTLGAMVGVLPLLLFHFGRVSIWTPLANLFLVPTFGVGGLSLGFGGLILPAPLGDFLLCAYGELWTWVQPLLSFLAKAPGSDLWISPPSFLALIGYGAILVSIHHLFRSPQDAYRKMFQVAGIGGVIFLFSPYVARVWAPSFPSVHFLSVGQGDSVVVRSAEGEVMVIDTGPPPGFPLTSWLKSHGHDRIDRLVLTHGEEDHAGGAVSLIEGFEVGEIWMGRDPRSGLVEEIHQKANERKIPIRWLDARSKPSGMTGIDVEILSPPAELEVKKNWSRNDRSLVLRLQVKGYSVLLTGDIGQKTEKYLLDQEIDLKSEILKVAHHGSRTSTSQSFLSEVRPRLGILSAGWRNLYRHPSRTVRQRLEDRGIRYRRTDCHGEIIVEFEGKNLTATSKQFCQDLSESQSGSGL